MLVQAREIANQSFANGPIDDAENAEGHCDDNERSQSSYRFTHSFRAFIAFSSLLAAVHL